MIERGTAVLDVHALEELPGRLRRARLPSEDGPSWDRGVPSEWLADLVADWRDHDFSAQQARLDAMEHLFAQVGDQRIHCLYFPGVGPAPAPLILTHGWPSSVLEFMSVAPLLADPARHGANTTDAFTVIVPSLPGFGFSGPPPHTGLTPREVAALWHTLLEQLGYGRYFAHGGDLGVGVTAWLARDHPDAAAAVHLATPGLPAPPRPWSPEEDVYVNETARWSAEEGGYAHEQSTKPATLGAALLDSPVGLAAWIGEKVVAWSATEENGDPRFPRRLLLDTLTLYWCSGTIATSFLPYWRYRHDPDAALLADAVSSVPTAVGLFGGERVPFPKVPRALAERYFDVVSWSEHDSGGHFPAVAAPELLAESLRACFRPYR